jgi:hypothetical protein
VGRRWTVWKQDDAGPTERRRHPNCACGRMSSQQEEEEGDEALGSCQLAIVMRLPEADSAIPLA